MLPPIVYYIIVTFIIVGNLWNYARFIKILRSSDEQLEPLAIRRAERSWVEKSIPEATRDLRRMARYAVIGYSLIIALFIASLATGQW
jgi:hypothetical protein